MEKGGPLERANYKEMKLTDHFLKMVERVIQKLIRQQVGISEMLFGFTPGHGTKNTIFILRQRRFI